MAMDRNVYNEGLANSMLPEGYSYEFDKIDVISGMDENGELQIDIIGRVNITKVEDVKTFLGEFYASSGSTFNMKSGRADRKGVKDVKLYGYRKCIMQVPKQSVNNPQRKGLHQDCPAEITFRLETPKVECNIKYLNNSINAFFLAFARLFSLQYKQM